MGRGNSWMDDSGGSSWMEDRSVGVDPSAELPDVGGLWDYGSSRPSIQSSGPAMQSWESWKPAPNAPGPSGSGMNQSLGQSAFSLKPYDENQPLGQLQQQLEHLGVATPKISDYNVERGVITTEEQQKAFVDAGMREWEKKNPRWAGSQKGRLRDKRKALARLEQEARQFEPTIWDKSGPSAGFQEGGLASLFTQAGSPPEVPVAAEEMIGVEESYGPGGDEESIQVFMEAREALSGNHPDPAAALKAFVSLFGIDALEQLKAELQGGDGMSDSVPGMIDGTEEVALSSGEFVVPADAVSGAGNGSTDAGARRLMSMVDEIRRSRTGTERPAEEINAEEILIG